jgi:Domain of unknown function (DUF4868)
MEQNNLQKQIELLNIDVIPFLTMYFVFKTDAGHIIRVVDLDKDVSEELAVKFKQFLLDKYLNKELIIGALSTADGRKYDVLTFDIDVVPPLNELVTLLLDPDQPAKYSHKEDKKFKLDGYVFIIGNKQISISFYKEHYPVDLIRRDSIMFFGRSDSRLVSIPQDEIFKVTNKIDFIYIGSILYALNEKVLERNFKIHDILKKKAESVMDDINKRKFLENPRFINDIINENPAFARKILRVNKESPVINLPFTDIKIFITKHPHLNGKLKFNKKGNKISLDTKYSAQLFIKLMDDDFLRSELSKQLYESIVKDRIEKK